MIILAIIHVHISTSVSVQSNVTYGDCESEDENCATCYLRLKESLLRRDRNIQNLNMAFFPPKDNLPDFVTVTYCFDRSCTIPQKWFWTRDSSYLFFPIETFQYLSLFFGKPAAFFTQTVQLQLDEECHNASTDMFTLLTQRVSYTYKMYYNGNIMVIYWWEEVSTRNTSEVAGFLSGFGPRGAKLIWWGGGGRHSFLHIHSIWYCSGVWEHPQPPPPSQFWIFSFQSILCNFRLYKNTFCNFDEDTYRVAWEAIWQWLRNTVDIWYRKSRRINV